MTAELGNTGSCVDLTQIALPMTTITIGTTPMEVAMGVVGGQLTVAVVNIGDDQLVWTSVPAMPAPNFVSLPGFTKIPQLYSSSTAIFAEGWELKIFDSGPMAGTAAVLSRVDKAVWFVNLATHAVTGPYAMPHDAFRIIPDNTHDTLIVALTDPSGLSGGTRFAKVDPATGTVTPLASTSSFLAVGFTLSPDAGKLVICMRNKCEFQPNQ